MYLSIVIILNGVADLSSTPPIKLP